VWSKAINAWLFENSKGIVVACGLLLVRITRHQVNLLGRNHAVSTRGLYLKNVHSKDQHLEPGGGRFA